ncbi:MAG: response regulator [Desulfarculus sp.]|nr:response regulator [Desulfarculus sp.]
MDDEEALRDLGAGTLKAQGYQVRTARSGEEALESYQAGPGAIDLVIMDLSMPGMGGQTCLIKILALNPRAKVGVIWPSPFSGPACWPRSGRRWTTNNRPSPAPTLRHPIQQ